MSRHNKFPVLLEPKQLYDHHAGILIGFLLGQKAPAQVKQALYFVLERYTSRAGDLIGEACTTEKVLTQEEISFILKSMREENEKGEEIDAKQPETCG